jgi:single-strand DNA-binding protein
MLNHVVLSGNLGHDPETKYYGENQDQPVTTFSLALRVNRTRTGWIRVVCFNRLAEVAGRYLHQGAKVVVAGVLDQQKFETQDGQSRNGFSLMAQSLEFIKIDGEGKEAKSPEGEVPF